MLDELHPMFICPECEVRRTKRSNHCVICCKCVDVYDHHCPWVNNCIGKKNHRVFMVFIFSVMASLLMTLLSSIFACIEFHPDRHPFGNFFKTNQWFFWFLHALMFAFVSLYMLPVASLIVTQIQNLR